jgi:putative endonuclease
VQRFSTRKTGTVGELLAQRYLVNKGFILIKNNVYTRYGEIDIIARLGNIVHFIEVKYVTSTRYCNSVELYTSRKRQHIYRTVRFIIHKFNLYLYKYQIDLLCLTKDRSKVWFHLYPYV